MQLPENIFDNIFRYLPPVSYQELVKYSCTNRGIYYAARKEFYKNLTITDDVSIPIFLNCLQNYDIKDLIININLRNRSRTSRPPVAQEHNSYILLNHLNNLRSIFLWNLNPFFILQNIRKVKLYNLERIEIDWTNCNHSDAVKRDFYKANMKYRSTINYLSMPPNPNNEIIVFDYNRIHYELTEDQFARLFNISSYHRFGLFWPVAL